jgi:hypothetical protein
LTARPSGDSRGTYQTIITLDDDEDRSDPAPRVAIDKFGRKTQIVPDGEGGHVERFPDGTERRATVLGGYDGSKLSTAQWMAAALKHYGQLRCRQQPLPLADGSIKNIDWLDIVNVARIRALLRAREIDVCLVPASELSADHETARKILALPANWREKQWCDLDMKRLINANAKAHLAVLVTFNGSASLHIVPIVQA